MRNRVPIVGLLSAAVLLAGITSTTFADGGGVDCSCEVGMGQRYECERTVYLPLPDGGFEEQECSGSQHAYCCETEELPLWCPFNCYCKGRWVWVFCFTVPN